MTSYIEDNPNQIVNREAPFGETRRYEFDASLHKSLNAELKYLYTAITRAKCNLWIYDSNRVKRSSIFDYWVKKGLVKIIRVGDNQDTLFLAASSSKEDWKSRGNRLKRKGIWEEAIKCYQKAECPHLLLEARAYGLAQKALTQSKDLFLNSAHAFLKCNETEYNYHFLENAAKCLKNAKQYEESAELYVYLGQVS